MQPLSYLKDHVNPATINTTKVLNAYDLLVIVLTSFHCNIKNKAGLHIHLRSTPVVATK